MLNNLKKDEIDLGKIPVVSVNNLYKSFGDPLPSSTIKESLIHPLRSAVGNRRGYVASAQQVLRGISFELDKGDFFGIVGRNGSGKSTLLRVLAGIYQCDKGDVKVQGRVVPFIELGAGFNGDLTGRENVYLNGALLGFSRADVDAKYREIVEFAELDDSMDKKLKNYSSGMQVRLAFSIATRLAESDVLLIDEVLAVGDADFQRKCFSYFKSLKKDRKTVIFITHDMNAVREYCNKAMLINDGKVVLSGDPEDVAVAYTRMFQEDSLGKEQLANKQNRWGGGEATFTDVIISHKTLREENEVLHIETPLCCNVERIDEVVAGISIMDASGARLFGSNNRIRKQIIKNLKSGEIATLTWRIPNIFNEGEYSICVSASDTDGYMYDSWDEAVPFSVYKEQSTSFPVDPALKLTIKRTN